MLTRGRQQLDERDYRRRMGQFLDPALLLLLEQSPAHGYTLLSRMAEFSLNFLAPAVIYRALRGMEAQGWVKSTMEVDKTQGPPRRIYTLTSTGRQVLQCCLIQLQGMQQMFEYLLALHAELAPEGRYSQIESDPTVTKVARQVAIPAKGASLDAPTSQTFERTPMFVLVDPETLAYNVLSNPACHTPAGAGVQAAQVIVQHPVRAVIARHLGMNTLRVIQAAGLLAYHMDGATVRQVVTAYSAGKLRLLETPVADAGGFRRRRYRHGGR